MFFTHSKDLESSSLVIKNDVGCSYCVVLWCLFTFGCDVFLIFDDTKCCVQAMWGDDSKWQRNESYVSERTSNANTRYGEGMDEPADTRSAHETSRGIEQDAHASFLLKKLGVSTKSMFSGRKTLTR